MGQFQQHGGKILITEIFGSQTSLSVVILAAGEGSRFQSKKSPMVKFLYPIKPNSTITLLSLLVDNLKSSPFTYIVFIGGAYFPELKNYLEVGKYLFCDSFSMKEVHNQIFE